MKTIAIMVCSILMTGCGLSCEDRGGKKIRDGSRLQMVGKILMKVPKYKCVGAKE